MGYHNLVIFKHGEFIYVHQLFLSPKTWQTGEGSNQEQVSEEQAFFGTLDRDSVRHSLWWNNITVYGRHEFFGLANRSAVGALNLQLVKFPPLFGLHLTCRADLSLASDDDDAWYPTVGFATVRFNCDDNCSRRWDHGGGWFLTSTFDARSVFPARWHHSCSRCHQSLWH